MLRTAKNLYRISKSIAIGVTIGRAQRFLARRYQEDNQDPLYSHWLRALDTVVVDARLVFDKATGELIKELNDTLEAPAEAGRSEKKKGFTVPLGDWK